MREYLSHQCFELLVALKTCAGGSRYLLPSRYDLDKPMSSTTLNRVIDATVERAQKAALPLEHFGVHDLRRTASTLLHEAGFNSDWIERCLAHEQRGVRAVYNKAEYAIQRRHMLQEWANMVDARIGGRSYAPVLMRSDVPPPRGRRERRRGRGGGNTRCRAPFRRGVGPEMSKNGTVRFRRLRDNST
jgi:hypothetical protein